MTGASSTNYWNQYKIDPIVIDKELMKSLDDILDQKSLRDSLIRSRVFLLWKINNLSIISFKAFVIFLTDMSVEVLWAKEQETELALYLFTQNPEFT